MDVIDGLARGFAIALLPHNLVACFIGVFVGTLVGVLPGLGPTATLAMLLPLTFGMSPTTSIIMFAGIFYGCKYGGAVTSVLVNLPGEASSLITCMEGYPMAKQGRAGPALGMSAIASFFAGTLGVVGLMLLAPPLSELAISFGPPEYFALMALGLTMVMFLAGKSMAKALMMGFLGLALATIGSDIETGTERLTFGHVFLLAGINFVVVAMGVFAVGEILVNIETLYGKKASIFKVPSRLAELLPTLKDLKESAATLVRSTILGFLVGTVPGATTAVATFLAYGATKAIAKDPEVFGTGTIRGVAAGESADNAATCGGLVPLLTLGIPGTGPTAIMLAALIMAGLEPGPLLMKQQPEFFWAVVASMYIGNVLLLILNLPLVPVFASMLKIPYHVLYPLILAICSVGVYSLNNSLSDIWLMGFFGVVGYALRKLDFPTAPLILAMVLGHLFEKATRQSLTIFDGNAIMFFQRPISAALLALTIVLFAISASRFLRAQRPALQQDAAN